MSDFETRRREPAADSRVGDTRRLTPTAMAHGGPALCRDESGRVVFLTGGLPGETVTARITALHARHADAVLTALPATPSPDRILAPPCPHFGVWPSRGEAPESACGGCQWQHVRYPAQLAFKQGLLVDALSRLGGLADPPVAEVIGMAQPWRYRNHVTVRATGPGFGFVAADGLTTVPIAECRIAHPLLHELLQALDPALPPGTEVGLRAGTATGDRMIVIYDAEATVELVEVEAEASVVIRGPRGVAEVAAGRPFLVEALAGRSFLIPPDGFFQVNSSMAEHLVDRVRAAVPARVDRLVDLYSGVGTFAILLADRAGEVYAVEADPAAVAAAVENAAGLDHVTLIEGPAHEGLGYLDGAIDVVVLDPPRGGVDRATMRLLADRRPDTIVYVSCEPATLARDARRLGEAGYRLASCQPVDMFPQTHHIESVSVFRPTGGASRKAGRG